MTNDGFICLDWGTTNFRAVHIDNNLSEVKKENAPKGVAALSKEDMVDLVSATVDQSPLVHPRIYACGMIGSPVGWCSVPYIECPVSISQVSAQLYWAQIGKHSVGIVPGLKFFNGTNWDVIRGEELQVFGWMLNQNRLNDECLAITPGTHSKWIAIENGQVSSFFTAMTGEIYALLGKQGLLKHHLLGTATPSEEFIDGVERGFEGSGLTRLLFSVRGNSLLAGMSKQQASDFVSGLLIGAEIQDGLNIYAGNASAQPITLIGTPELIQLYAIALKQKGVESHLIPGHDANTSAFKAIHDQYGDLHDAVSI